MKLCEVLYKDEYFCTDDIASFNVGHITSDVHDIREDTLFFLVRGVSYDTSRLLPAILSKKPKAIVAEAWPDVSTGGIPIAIVASARRALSFALYRLYLPEGLRIPIVGITGTNGKTTTATMLAHILTCEGKRVGRILTGGIYVGDEPLTDAYYSMTTPDPAVLYKALATMNEQECDVIVMEVSSHALSLGKVASLSFAIGIFTNLSAEHLDFHKDMEDYFACKASLFSQCALGIVNIDDPYARRIQKTAACPMISVGALYDADVMARSVEDLGLDGCRYLYRTQTLSFIARLQTVGVHNVYNSMLALCAAIKLSVPPYRAKAHISSLCGICGRMEKIASNPTVYIDYAHTPEALRSALNAVNSCKKQGQKVLLVFGCGGDRDREKRPKMARVAEEGADVVFVTSDNTRTEASTQILTDILSGFSSRESCRVISDRRNAIETAVREARPCDIVIIAGKGHERYTLDRHGYHPFDERKIALDVLNET